MDFDLPPPLPVSSIPWERVLPPLFPRRNGTVWTPIELVFQYPHATVSEHTRAAQVTCDHNRFTVQVDVKHFSPEDLLVKVVGDYVVVEGKHEQKKKDGSGLVTRQINRRDRIPNEVDIMALESAMSTEGMLVMTQGDNSRLLNHSRP
uniref:Heat shock protein, alpha-crystallin-related, b6 n=1 Tax=Cyprinus carpio TaxID=7962 RepID=A0A8C1ZCS1_CYPCA